MRHCDEPGNAERNRQMHDQSRIKWILNLQERANKNRNAQKPGNTANCRSKPWQMNQSAARSHKWRRIDRWSRTKTVEQFAKRENSAEPQDNADGIDYEIVNDDRFEKTLPQGGRNE